MVPAVQQRLDGWKSIAAYLNRTTRTVQRWEKLEGLPVHRIGHTSSASVFAYSEELDTWWNDRKSRLEVQPPPVEDSAAPQRRHRSAAIPAVLGLLAIGAAASYIQFRPRPRFANAEVLTPVNHGNVEMAVISPDGRMLVYAWDIDNQHTLTVRDLASGEERILTQGVYSRYFGLTFSLDGRTLFFTAQQPAHGSSLYRIPLEGGSAMRLVEGVDSPVSFSPGGERIAFVRETEQSQLMVANPDGTGLRRLVSRKLPEYFDYPAWSPDGSVIVATLMSGDGGRLMAVNPKSGSIAPVGSQVWSFLRFPVWLDRKTLAVSLRVSRRASERLFLISYPQGTAKPLNLPGDRFLTLSASRDGRSLAGVMRNVTASVWAAEGSGEPREILPPVARNRGVAWNGNGRLLFGPREISSVKADGSDLALVLSGIEFSSFAACSPHSLVYSRSDRPNVGLWQTAIPGGPSRLLTARPNVMRPRCSPDGAWVIYSERWSSAYQVPSTGGAEQLLIADAVYSPSISWDNRWIAAYRNRKDGATTGPQEIAIYPRGGGSAVKTLPVRPGEFEWRPLGWTQDNQAVGYIETQAGVANIWVQPIDGSPRRQLTHFRGGRVIEFDWAADGHLAIEFGSVVRDIYLVRERRN